MNKGSLERHQPFDQDACRARLAYQDLLQDHLKLQKEFVSRKRKLQTMKHKRETILSEVRFLRRKRGQLLEVRSQRLEQEHKLAQLQNLDTDNSMLEKRRNYCANGDDFQLPCINDVSYSDKLQAVGENARQEQDVLKIRSKQRKPKPTLVDNKKNRQEKNFIAKASALEGLIHTH